MFTCLKYLRSSNNRTLHSLRKNLKPNYNSSQVYSFSHIISSKFKSPAYLKHFPQYNLMDTSLPTADQRLESLRQQLEKYDVDCFIQTTNDAHQSEYVGDRDKRLGYVSCFTGSAGKILISQKEALLWTDGRYFVQAENQLSPDWALMKQGQPETPSITNYISKQASTLKKIGIDPFLCSISFYKTLLSEIDKNYSSQEIISLPTNLVDEIWKEYGQPSIPDEKIFHLPLEYSGQSSVEKVELIRSKMVGCNIYALVIPKLDHIAWLLNLRGNDVTYNPVFVSYCILTLNECILYTNVAKLEKKVDESKSNSNENVNKIENKMSTAEYLKSINVSVRDYYEFIPDLQSMVAKNANEKFWIDIRFCNLAIWNSIPLQQRYENDDPIELLKSIKNETELNGMINCHVRDGAAKTRFFSWVNQLREEKEIEQHTEWSFAEKILQLRSEMDKFVDLSFQSISSSAGNGAIIHYGPTAEKHSPMKANDIYLLDSGAQYFDGTTDVTRTVWLGIDGELPSEHHRECFTRVLKGVINLTQCVFPSNTKGPTLDCIARMFLWQSGLDYTHGTGHGVGSFLNVHEGPQGFSASSTNSTLMKYGLVKNMIITNEPGYYELGNFGMRIENVMIVVGADTKHNFGNKEFCTFKTITLVPIDLSLIDVNLLEKREVQWINEYHREVRETLMPFMTTEYERNFLTNSTIAI